jgi:pimeloyl-ACP methyl ester carboxylesterase
MVMKMKNKAPLIVLFVIGLLSLNCGGIKHAHKAPLAFVDIDYGYETKFLAGNPGIAYIDEGTGEQTLFLVHGLASNAGFWRYNIAELAKDYRVIAVDLPGYGKSEKGDFPYGMEFYANELSDFIERMDLQNVVYVGHSMGGQIGITLAINHPESIETLILAAPAGIEKFDRGEGEWLANVFTQEGIVKAPEPTIRENLSLNFYRWNPEWEWMVEERVRMAKSPEMNEFAYTVVESVKAMINEPTSDYLHLISHPTLIIYGKQDGLIPNRYLNPGHTFEVFEQGAGNIPNATTKALDNTGHLLQIENPEGFNTALLEYLNK